MFVFPAFNSNYKTRKRTFKCCRICRSKRMKCIISLTDYETVGCDNCKKNGFQCDLITAEEAKFEKKDDPDPKARENSTLASHNTRPSEKFTPDHPYQDGFYPQSPWQWQPEQMSYPNQNYNVNNFYGHPVPGQIPTMPNVPITNIPHNISNLNINSTNQYPPYYNDISQPYEQLPSQAPSQSTDSFKADLGNVSFNQSSLETSLNDRLPLDQNQYIARNMRKPAPQNQSPALLISTTDSIFSPFRPTNPDMNMVTTAYLKETFGFTIGTTKAKLDYFFIPDNEDLKVDLAQNTKGPLRKKKRKDSSNKTQHLLNPFHYQLLKNIDAFTLSSPSINVSINDANLVRILEIYFFKINSIFPIIREKEFWTEIEKQNVPNVLIYCLILATARDALCKPVFIDVFGDESDYEAKLIEYMMNLEMKIRQIFMVLPELGDDDILNRLKCLLLLTFHFNFNSYGNEQNGHDLTAAINYGFNLFIHMNITHEKLSLLGLTENSQYLQLLWWICFIFDRFNAVVNARAMFIKRVDFNIEIPSDPHLHELVMATIQLEKMLVAIYQPNVSDSKSELSDIFEEENSLLTEESLKAATLLPAVRQKPHLPQTTIEAYRTQTRFFIIRLIKGLIILAVMRYEQRKVGPERKRMMNSTMFNCMENIVRLYEAVCSNETGHDLMLSIPTIVCSLAFYAAIPIRCKISILSGQLEAPLEGVDRLINRYRVQVAKFGNLWWFMKTSFENIDRVIEEMKKPAQDSLDDEEECEKKEMPADKTEANRDKLKIKSLLSSDSTLPLLMSISSPSLVNFVIERGGIKRKSKLAKEVTNDSV